MATDTPLHRLSAQGQSVWADNLSRAWVQDGELARLVKESEVVGVTSNPSIFQKALAEGPAYDEQLKELLPREPDPKEVFVQVATVDIQGACDVMFDVWDGGRGLKGWVSLEVDPTLANDTDATVKEALRLRDLVDRPNLMVKIPATKEGLQAIEEVVAAGQSVNVTLIFGIERHREVAEHYLRGLERFVEGGGDPAPVASVASFFVSRVDSEADKRLGEGHELRGKLAVANAKLAYADVFTPAFTGPRWQKLADRGATPQWCLWASTGVKDDAYPDTMYVDELVVHDSINTMPLDLIEAVKDHGNVRGETALEGVEEARQVLKDLEAAGLDYEDVINTIELEGVDKFKDSFRELLEGIQTKREQLGVAA